MASAEAVAAVIEAGGAHVPELLDRLEVRLAEVAASHGAVLAEHAGATISAGGKAAAAAAGVRGRGLASDGVLRAAVAVELVHSATLVHDDVLDAAQLRRGRPTVVAAAAASSRPPPATCSSRARSPSCVANGRADEVRVLSDASSALAQGELMQRSDAWNVGVSRERYLERCDSQDRAAVRGRLPAGRARGRRADELLGQFGRRIGLAFQLLDDVLDVSGPASAPASTAAPTCSTARSRCR
jgi:geranylgeranyl pyrophosphate synthase